MKLRDKIIAILGFLAMFIAIGSMFHDCLTRNSFGFCLIMLSSSS